MKVFLRKWFSKIIRVALALIIVGSTLAPLAAPARVAAAPVYGPPVALADSLLANFDLDTPSAGPHYDDTRSGGVNFDLRPGSTGGVTSGLIGNGFDTTAGLSGYISPTASLTVPVNSALTMGIWTYFTETTTAPSHHGIIQRGRDWPAANWRGSYSLYLDKFDGKVVFEITNESYGQYSVRSDVTITSHAWHYIVATIDDSSNTLSLVIDDGAPKTTSYVGHINNSPTYPSTYIGNMWLDWSTDNRMVGKVDEISFWSRTLTSVEIDYLYNQGYGCAYPWVTCVPPNAAWQIGNYIADGDMENDTVWDNSPWGYWGSGPAFTFSRRQTVPWTNLNNQPACGSYLRVSTNSGSNGATSLSQKFFWYGGDMYLSWAMRTDATAKVYPYLTTPFGDYIALAPDTNTSMPSLPALETFNPQFYFSTYNSDPFAQMASNEYQTKSLYPLTATGSNWQIFTVHLPDQWLGNYSLTFFAKGNLYSQYAIDCVTVSEIGYEPQTYNATPLDPPTTHGTLLQRAAPFIQATRDNLLWNSDLASTNNGLVVDSWHLGLGVYSIALTNPTSGKTSGLMVRPPTQAEILANQHVNGYLGRISSKAWAEVGTSAVEQAEAHVRNFDTMRGYNSTKARATPVNKVDMSYTIVAGEQVATTAVFTAYFTQLFGLQNVETGEKFTAKNLASNVLYEGGEGRAVKFRATYDLPPGRYRVYELGGNTYAGTYYLDAICLTPDLDYLNPLNPSSALYSLGKCDDAYNMPEDLITYVLRALNVIDSNTLPYANTTVLQQTSIARSTNVAYVNATATQAWANYYGTATQAAVLGNAAQQQTAIAQINYAATATPAAAATATAFVNNFNATNTAIAANSLTQQSANVIASGQMTVAAQTQSAVSTQQAAAQATLWGQATSNAKLTQQVSGQATLVQQQTQNAIYQATLAPQRTAAAQTQSAAATSLAAGANATSSYVATQSAANATAVQAVQQTLAAQSAAQQTQSAIGVATQSQYAGTATAVAQYQPTLMWQQQQQATQQVLQYPPTQPDFAWDANCNKPDNALNLAWWIEYEVCRVTAWFSWSPVNTTQVTNIPRLCNDYEPCGTFNGLKRAIDKFMFLWPFLSRYDGQQCTRRVVEPGSIFRSANGFMNGTQPFSITVVDTGAISDQCDLAISTIVGPGLKRGFCITINVLCYYGLLPWFSWAVNFATITLVLFYIKILRGRVIV